jgi:hypothetical protein
MDMRLGGLQRRFGGCQEENNFYIKLKKMRSKGIDKLRIYTLYQNFRNGFLI